LGLSFRWSDARAAPTSAQFVIESARAIALSLAAPAGSAAAAARDARAIVIAPSKRLTACARTPSDGSGAPNFSPMATGDSQSSSPNRMSEWPAYASVRASRMSDSASAPFNVRIRPATLSASQRVRWSGV
jgi:hypothetical protein